jgi:hypothetical protein
MKKIFILAALVVASIGAFASTESVSAAGEVGPYACTNTGWALAVGPDTSEISRAAGTYCSVSPNKAYKAQFQYDGNLVVYKANGQAIWASGTAGQGATRLKFQKDGNLVIYRNDQAIWSSQTNGSWFNAKYRYLTLAMQNDGNLVIYRDESIGGAQVALWSTFTGRLY